MTNGCLDETFGATLRLMKGRGGTMGLGFLHGCPYVQEGAGGLWKGLSTDFGASNPKQLRPA